MMDVLLKIDWMMATLYVRAATVSLVLAETSQSGASSRQVAFFYTRDNSQTIEVLRMGYISDIFRIFPSGSSHVRGQQCTVAIGENRFSHR